MAATFMLTGAGVAQAQEAAPPSFNFNENADRMAIEFKPISSDAINQVREARGVSVETVAPGVDPAESTVESTTEPTVSSAPTVEDSPRTPTRTTVTVTQTVAPPPLTTTQVLPPEWDGYVYDGSEGLTTGGVNIQDMQVDWNAPLAQQIVQLVKTQIGVPYVWGGNSWRENGAGGGLDCSALVQQAYRRIGVELPRTTWDQINSGRRIPVSDLKPGDLVFGYNTGHVQVVTKVNPDGSGEVVHAPQPGQTVTTASLGSMPIENAVRVI